MLPAGEQFLRAHDIALEPREKMRAAAREAEKDMDPEQLAKRRYLDLVEHERLLSVDRLRTHIWRNHPKKVDHEEEDYKNWSICENIGSLVAYACCVKRKISTFTKNLGPGPSLFVLSLKSYIRLFLALSVLCVPVCIVLVSGS